MKVWLMNITSELDCNSNQAPTNKTIYNMYLLMCKLIGWL